MLRKQFEIFEFGYFEVDFMKSYWGINTVFLEIFVKGRLKNCWRICKLFKHLRHNLLFVF